MPATDLILERNAAGTGFLFTGGSDGQVLKRDTSESPEGVSWQSTDTVTVTIVGSAAAAHPVCTVVFSPAS